MQQNVSKLVASSAPAPCLSPQDPSSLAGLSLATIQLASAGNALMVPRALFTRDWVWLVGECRPPASQSPHAAAVPAAPGRALKKISAAQCACTGRALPVLEGRRLTPPQHRRCVLRAGSLWGSLVFGWAQMLSMWLGTSPAGARYLATPLFAGATLLLWGWYAGIFTANARAKRAAAAGAAKAAPAPQ